LEVLNSQLWNAIMMDGYDDGYDSGRDVLHTTDQIAALRSEIDDLTARLG
jgi:hypothetical protein